MHIPENYLSPSTCAVLGAVMAPVWLMAVHKVRREIPREKMPLLGIGAAFSFLSMMFNIPLPGGTTGHAVGGTLLAVLFGPWSACLTVSIALFIQALFFGDGGILAFGANCFNMALVMPFSGWAVYRGCRHRRLCGDQSRGPVRGCGIWHSANAVYGCSRTGALLPISAADFHSRHDGRASDPVRARRGCIYRGCAELSA